MPNRQTRRAFLKHGALSSAAVYVSSASAASGGVSQDWRYYGGSPRQPAVCGINSDLLDGRARSVSA